MTAVTPRVDAVDPQDAFDLMRRQASTALVDVRSKAEWTFVGLPDLSGIDRPLHLVEWASFPSMLPNPRFVPQLCERLGGEVPERLFFICRSGGRSMMAAQALAEALSADGRTVHCTNVAEGFEGDLDADARRGRVSGWKARGLPWSQT